MMNARGKEKFGCNYLFIHLGYDACLVIGMNFYIQLNHNSCVVFSLFSKLTKYIPLVREKKRERERFYV